MQQTSESFLHFIVNGKLTVTLIDFLTLIVTLNITLSLYRYRNQYFHKTSKNWGACGKFSIVYFNNISCQYCYLTYVYFVSFLFLKYTKIYYSKKFHFYWNTILSFMQNLKKIVYKLKNSMLKNEQSKKKEFMNYV